MFCKRLYKVITNVFEYKMTTKQRIFNSRNISVSHMKTEEKRSKAVTTVGSFEKIENKDKNTYLEMIQIFINRDEIYRRGHVEFIYSALKNMDQFGVIKDLEVYKALIDVLPKGKFIPTNIFQSEFMHYPKQQQCVIDLLQQMEDNGVMPDTEMEPLLLNIFGKRGFPLRKFWRMMYWMPKFKNLSPWPLPRDIPNDSLELAKLAIARITSADTQAEISIFQASDIEDSVDHTWIVSGQCPAQRQLIAKHNIEEPLYVEGAFRVWIKDKPVNYFMLRANATQLESDEVPDLDDVSRIEIPFFSIKPPIHKYLIETYTVHEQDDGVILALCATGTSSKDSLLSWIRHLEKNGNPSLATIPIVFTLRSSTAEVAIVENSNPKDVQPS